MERIRARCARRPRGMPEERKLVTVLFADIVGSTEMGLSHDPEVIRGVLGRAFESASEILGEHGGTVEKFIGDAVMAVFGVPAAHDDDPDRAVRAAFVLRDRIARADPEGGPQLRVRIGVNTGERADPAVGAVPVTVPPATRLLECKRRDSLDIGVGDLQTPDQRWDRLRPRAEVYASAS